MGVSSTALLLSTTTILNLVFLTSLASAEFLTPVKDQDDVTLPKMCEEDTVISCTLVHIDLDCLNNDTLVFNDTTLTFLDQPGNDSFTFSSAEGDEATFTLDEEIGAVWGHVELADTRDFIIEPLDLDTCPAPFFNLAFYCPKFIKCCGPKFLMRAGRLKKGAWMSRADRGGQECLPCGPQGGAT